MMIHVTFQDHAKAIEAATLLAKFFPRIILFSFTHYSSFTEVGVLGSECWLLGCIFGIMVFS